MSQSSVAVFSWPKINDIALSVADGSMTAVANVEKALSLIREYDNTYHAILSTCEELALEKAKKIDDMVASGEWNAEEYPLLGVPFIAKDNLLVKGTETTAASNMLKGFVAPYTATAVQRLENAGAICVGKANLDAFAHGGSTENSDFGVTKNPHDTGRVPGGSSGGSAAAMALGYTPFTLGTDTGGSIRQPASFCGVVGFKPTYGRVSRSGAVAMASSTDVIGPITSNTEDTALIMSVMSGKDELDSTTIDSDPNEFRNVSDKKSVTVGVVKELLSDAVAPEIREEVEAAAQAYRDNGHKVVEVSIPTIDVALATYYVLVPAELSSNLSRHDGQRYQYSADDTATLEESYEKSRTSGFGREAKRRIMLGTYVLSSGFYDAYYKKAQKARTKLISEFNKAFETCDVLLGPTTPSVAFKIGELTDDPIQMYAQDIMTVSVNLAGLPAISMPVVRNSSMPIGVQIIGQHKKDAQVLEVASLLEGRES